jgi:hypothetical protein
LRKQFQGLKLNSFYIRTGNKCFREKKENKNFLQSDVKMFRLNYLCVLFCCTASSLDL